VFPKLCNPTGVLRLMCLWAAPSGESGGECQREECVEDGQHGEFEPQENSPIPESATFNPDASGDFSFEVGVFKLKELPNIPVSELMSIACSGAAALDAVGTTFGISLGSTDIGESGQIISSSNVSELPIIFGVRGSPTMPILVGEQPYVTAFGVGQEIAAGTGIQ